MLNLPAIYYILKIIVLFERIDIYDYQLINKILFLNDKLKIISEHYPNCLVNYFHMICYKTIMICILTNGNITECQKYISQYKNEVDKNYMQNIVNLKIEF